MDTVKFKDIISYLKDQYLHERNEGIELALKEFFVSEPNSLKERLTHVKKDDEVKYYSGNRLILTVKDCVLDGEKISCFITKNYLEKPNEHKK
ncbi:hypothetical protein [Klebsiella phage 05F01]|nr:hypothetical protein [Klebsiella phage 05F01]